MTEREPEGATPLNREEAAGLLPPHIGTRDELNVWEQRNILEAAVWVSRTRRSALDEGTVRELHQRMFDRTWDWAGQYRLSDKNIGVAWAQVPAQILKLMGDGKYWLAKKTYTPDEAALRLHHRLVKIHPFPNGNGRHARLWCDLLLTQEGRPLFNWKNAELERTGDARRAYIHALQAADGNCYQPLFHLFLTGRE